MNKRYDVCSPRPKKGSDKVFWHKVGAAWENEQGKISIKLDSSPYPSAEGEVWIKLFEAKEQDADTRRPAPAPKRPLGDMDDEIPF